MLAALVGALCLSYPAAHAQKDKTKGKQPTPAPSAAAVFELYKDKAGDYRFRFKDAEGDTLAVPTKVNCAPGAGPVTCTLLGQTRSRYHAACPSIVSG
jgi:hypothetical protein